jgi:protein-S-isoprenylcysteine O-methyltransferase Ste14
MHVLTVVGVATCWGAFALTWVSGAVYNAFRGPTQRTRAPYGSVVVIVGFIVRIIDRTMPRTDWPSLTVQSLWVRGFGLVLLVGFTAFRLWARLVLGTMWSSAPMVKQEHELRTDGPYGVTRHPIYTGMLGMVLGTVLLVGVGRWALIFPVGLVLFEMKIRMEEPLMEATFPDQYPRYRLRVPQLVPGLRLVQRRRISDV